MTIMQREPPTKAADQIFYPESDGKPMAETDLHREIMIWIIHLLQRFLAGQRAYVSGNLLIYYEQGNPRKSVAPDCFVVWGVESRYRVNYKLWEEGQAPQVVFRFRPRPLSATISAARCAFMRSWAWRNTTCTIQPAITWNRRWRLFNWLAAASSPCSP